MNDFTHLLGEALAKARVAEDQITEQLAYMVLEKDHPNVRRQGTFQWQISRLKGELVDAQAVTDALRTSLARASAKHFGTGAAE